VAALLRDIDPEAVAQGAALARRWGLDGRVRYERGDALDGEGFAVTPRPVEQHLLRRCILDTDGAVVSDERVCGHDAVNTKFLHHLENLIDFFKREVRSDFQENRFQSLVRFPG
jgi:hypothetical protein